MLSTWMWLVLALISFVIAAMLATYAVWYYENQKLLDLTNRVKTDNEGVLNGGMGKRSFSTFDLTTSILRSKELAGGIVRGVQQLGSKVSNSNLINSAIGGAKKTLFGIGRGVETLVTPLHKTEKPSLSPQEVYQEDVTKLITQTQEPSQSTMDTASATIGMVAKQSSSTEDLTLFEKLELRILTRLKETGMSNYDIWLELGGLYQKFGQSEKAKEVYALILKHGSDQVKERARNELIGLG